MEWVETVGKTVQEAIETALDELGVDESDAEVVVVDEPKSSLFGFRKAEARVRARVRPAPPRPKRQQRRRGGENRGDAKSRSRQAGGAAPKNKEAAPKEPKAADESQEIAAVAGTGSTGNRSGNRSRRGGQGNKRRTENEGSGSPEQAEEAPMTVEQQQELVGDFVRGVVERFGFEATTSVRAEDDYIFVDVVGDDLGLLVGPKGSTLDAFQELTRTIIQRRSDEHAARVILDVAGFRAKRAAALQGFVERLVADVIASGEPQALEPMSPADRKIVHDTANANAAVSTTSEGVDPRRYVVIRPAAAIADEQTVDA